MAELPTLTTEGVLYLVGTRSRDLERGLVAALWPRQVEVIDTARSRAAFSKRLRAASWAIVPACRDDREVRRLFGTARVLTIRLPTDEPLAAIRVRGFVETGERSWVRAWAVRRLLALMIPPGWGPIGEDGIEGSQSDTPDELVILAAIWPQGIAGLRAFYRHARGLPRDRRVVLTIVLHERVKRFFASLGFRSSTEYVALHREVVECYVRDPV